VEAEIDRANGNRARLLIDFASCAGSTGARPGGARYFRAASFDEPDK